MDSNRFGAGPFYIYVLAGYGGGTIIVDLVKAIL
jgi:hypothetical protein